MSRAAEAAAFKQQQATGWQLVDESSARIAQGRARERAERKAEAHARSVERKRRYNAEWMRRYRAENREVSPGR